MHRQTCSNSVNVDRCMQFISCSNTWDVCVVIGFIETSFVIHWAIGIGINNRQRWRLLILTFVNALWFDRQQSSIHSSSIQQVSSSFLAKMNGTVHYAMVALRQTSGCKIIADYSTNPNPIYRTIALSTIDGLKTVEDDKISVDNSRYTVHVLIGELHYVCLTSKVNCPSSAIWVESCSQIFLQRLRTVYKDLPLADLSKNLTNLAEDEFSKPLKKIIEEYNQGIGCKNLTSKLEEELIEVRRILMNGVQKLIDRGERLDELIRKTQNLEISSRDFHVVSRTRQKKNSNLKIVIVTSAFILVLVVFLTVFIYCFEVYCNSYAHGTLMTTRTN
ncbi:PREDICTED: vesicle-associated membrane protein 712-like isoform X1 [Trachymyrmex septentrionalis]|uniref:vesicle-associated membrane protein 712-like isoform X1 n=1 Tax=Trachymyrmex septentrionalis TaxID=34720 RepID=UPI00084EF005|nr:PREDICTED: vesicle-associated membrane protein 712-like isoform X1 [Trachymyrmex septentrionalis]